MKATSLVLSLLVLSIYSFGQTPTICSIKLDEAPSLRGFKLGMNKNDADNLMPKGFIKSPNYIMASGPQFFGKDEFKDVISLHAFFFQNKLYDLEIHYDLGLAKWKDAKEFAKNISENSNLSYKFWRFEKASPFMSKMLCNDFTVEINSDINTIRLIDLNALPKIEAEKEEKKKAFKP